MSRPRTQDSNRSGSSTDSLRQNYFPKSFPKGIIENEGQWILLKESLSQRKQLSGQVPLESYPVGLFGVLFSQIFFTKQPWYTVAEQYPDETQNKTHCDIVVRYLEDGPLGQRSLKTLCFAEVKRPDRSTEEVDALEYQAWKYCRTYLSSQDGSNLQFVYSATIHGEYIKLWQFQSSEKNRPQQGVGSQGQGWKPIEIAGIAAPTTNNGYSQVWKDSHRAYLVAAFQYMKRNTPTPVTSEETISIARHRPVTPAQSIRDPTPPGAPRAPRAYGTGLPSMVSQSTPTRPRPQPDSMASLTAQTGALNIGSSQQPVVPSTSTSAQQSQMVTLQRHRNLGRSRYTFTPQGSSSEISTHESDWTRVRGQNYREYKIGGITYRTTYNFR